MNYSSSREVEKISITHAWHIFFDFIGIGLVVSSHNPASILFHEDYLSLNLALYSKSVQ